MKKDSPAHAPELSPVKRAQILEAARTTFRDVGYERSSVDAIASRAGVSKATLYNHFGDKKRLFLASFGAETEEVRKKFLSLLETPSGDIERDLRQIAEQLLRLSTSPNSIHRYRVLCAEADRFPELGRAIYECSFQLGKEKMVRFFERAAATGLLDVPNARDAATDFAALCTGPVGPRLHLGVIDKLEDEELRYHVDRAVRTFLRAYGRTVPRTKD